MDLQNLFEGFLSGTIASLFSALLIFIVGKIWGREKLLKGEDNKEFKIAKINVFTLSLFISSFFGVLSIFGFIFDWVKLGYFVAVTAVFIVLTSLAHEYQCPNCKRVFTRVTHEPEILNEESRPYRHQYSTNVYFADGSLKERKNDGREKIFMERIRTQRNNYSCNYCQHRWKGNVHERNLDLKNRPKPNVKNTSEKSPQQKELDKYSSW